MATTRATADAWYDPPAPCGHNVQLLRLLGLAVMIGILGALVLQYFLGHGKGETGADYLEAVAVAGEVPWRPSQLKSAAFGFGQAVFALMALGQTIELDGHRGQMEPVSAS
ncbi:hypothetical protein SFMTTN_1390 [Sulfuriferula multivorans]|uniref:Uncharacterized protein n=1 Tax=Sulfuriferula multivorans TaxID=1559896 RepID=A0A401JDF2_9PROT|nr:hypothetical protein [Sulfuriferula multivorans]GBL45580.1 hypothetical protein SFMTTN_1390 [Sulfuriferula multivorans]